MLMNDDKAQWEYKSDTEAPNSYSDNNVSNQDPISWTASEYITSQKPNSWYFLLVLGSVVAAGIGFLVTEDLITAVAVLVVAFAAGFFATRNPSSKKYVLEKGSLRVDDKKYNLGAFKSFSVVEEGAIDSIWFKPLARFQPFLVVYVSPEDEKKIVDMISQYLPFEPRELDAIDRLSKRLHF